MDEVVGVVGVKAKDFFVLFCFSLFGKKKTERARREKEKRGRETDYPVPPYLVNTHS